MAAQSFSPAVQSFNKSDRSDLGKRFNGCFLSVFQHSVGGWSNATGQGRDSDVQSSKWMFLHNNKHFPEYQSRKYQIRPFVYLHNGSKLFVSGKEVSLVISHG